MYVPTLISGSETLVFLSPNRSKIKVADMDNLNRQCMYTVVGIMRTDNEYVRKICGVKKPLQRHLE